ncbi:MAG: protein kinase [Planctomycetota bacterium]
MLTDIDSGSLDWRVLEFLLALREDQALGRSVSLREYLIRFSDRELEVAREYILAHAPDRAADDSLQSFGSFILHRVLGSGAEGTVVLATDRVLGRQVALKLRNGSGSDLEEARMVRAAHVLARLDHPAICKVHSAGRAGRKLWISMQYIEGDNLGVVLGAEKVQSAAHPAREIGRLLGPIADALAHAHDRGVLHRDIKPSNILVDRDGGTVLTDFGIATDADDADSLTQTGAICGTPAYLAPEVIESGVHSISSDLWSLGVVICEAALGESPFAALSAVATIRRVHGAEPWNHPRWPLLPADLRAVIATALAKDPTRRYSHARELAADLYRMAAGKPVLARNPSAYRRLHAWATARPGLAASIAAGVLVLTLGIAASLYLYVAERERSRHESERANLLETVARSSIFEMDARMRAGPGHTMLRARSLSDAVRALEIVVTTSATVDLWRAYCAALLRLGDVQGHPSGPNLGDVDSARATFERALDVAESRLRREPRQAEYVAGSLLKLADLEQDGARAEALYRRVLDETPTDRPTVRRLRAYALAALARAEFQRKQPTRALDYLDAAGEALRSDPDDRESVELAGIVDEMRVSSLAEKGELKSATSTARQLVTARGALPDGTRTARVYRLLANCLALENQIEESRANFDRAVEAARERVEIDSSDVGARHELADMLRSRGEALRHWGIHSEAGIDLAEAKRLLLSPGVQE